MSDRFDHAPLYVALFAAWVAMLGSLYLSEIAGYTPCTLCWYQRILMYPLAGVLSIGLLRRDLELPFLVLPFSLLGMGVSSYHYLLQKTDIFDKAATCAIGSPCTTIWVNWIGFITIPFLALTAFTVIAIMMLLAFNRGLPDPDIEGAPWIPVFTVIVVIVIAFGIVALANRDDKGVPIVAPYTSSDAAGVG